MDNKTKQENSTNKHAFTLRERLATPELLPVPGIYDGLSALLVEQAGFEAAFLSGACLAFARFGRPDMGLVSASELRDTVAIIRDRIAIPLIVDIDTGFGNALNVQRTVRELERAGASAMQLEDQCAPKRCGHMAGKTVISRDEMVGKIKAALDARTSEATLLIARTDALGVNGFDEALDRAEHYLEAGADALFIEAPASVGEMRTIGERFCKRCPLVHNLVEGSNTPIESPQELAALGYRVALYPAAMLHRTTPVARQLLTHLRASGTTLALRDTMYSLDDMNHLLGAPELLAAGKYYDAGE
ncbi:isocitrate lyase/PEP mutase family protein [Pseudohalioglobus sediminis]|uniref:Isocitrate lyase/PEP mutase family protein n=1 Tax=Pseudohalioglobus sediminis TaxID=2606449 RepID=A0A5B0X3X6_9GAMM|nr:isocitrate lyase/PEP mutase family protein [Pseudohalioglobus sediminis]KAA1193415.1 isocitrate lyase/PEP mutase family protein [Pseudohalioglobus sediminis]